MNMLLKREVRKFDKLLKQYAFVYSNVQTMLKTIWKIGFTSPWQAREFAIELRASALLPRNPIVWLDGALSANQSTVEDTSTISEVYTLMLTVFIPCLVDEVTIKLSRLHDFWFLVLTSQVACSHESLSVPSLHNSCASNSHLLFLQKMIITIIMMPVTREMRVKTNQLTFSTLQLIEHSYHIGFAGKPTLDMGALNECLHELLDGLQVYWIRILHCNLLVY